MNEEWLKALEQKPHTREDWTCQHGLPKSLCQQCDVCDHGKPRYTFCDFCSQIDTAKRVAAEQRAVAESALPAVLERFGYVLSRLASIEKLLTSIDSKLEVKTTAKPQKASIDSKLESKAKPQKSTTRRKRA